MAFEADRVVVELIAKVDQFDQPVKTSAQSFDASMSKITASATKAEQSVAKSSQVRARALERESAQIGQFTRALGNQLNDVGSLLSSARSPFVVPQREAPKVTNALRLVEVGGAAMAGVLGGIAVSAAAALAAALLDLVLKANTTEEKVKDLVTALKEHAEQSELARKAADIFSKSQEGVHDSLLRAEDARKKASDGLLTYGESANIAAKRNLELIDTNLKAAESALELAKAQAAAAAQVSFGAGGGASAASAQRFFSDQVSDIEKAIARLRADRKGFQAELNASRADLAAEAGKRAGDPVAKLNKQFDLEVAAAKKAAIATGQVTTELTKQIQAIERRREAALREARDRDKIDRSNQQSGRQINEAQARAIVAGIGGTVTSGTRSAEHNKNVGGVPNSLHTKGQALDIAKTAGLTLGKIVKAFEAEGVRLIEKLDEGDHFHVAWAKRGSGRQGPSDETLAKRAAAEAERAANRAQAYDNEKASLEDQVINARQALVTSAEEIAKLELTAIDLARAKYADQVAHLQSIGKLQDGEAVELLKLNEERAKRRAEAVKRREEERQFRMREAAIQRSQTEQVGGLQAQADLLQSQDGIAKTQRERAAIAQRLLDLQFAEERMMLQAAIDRETRLKAEYARTQSATILAELQQAEVDAALARQQLATIDQRQGNANTSGARENASPLESYFGDIQAQADDINTMFEQIAVGGLQNFTDRLTDAIVNFRSLGDVGRAVLAGITADLVNLAIRLILNATIGKLVQSTAAAGAAAGGAAVATAWAPAAAAVSLATFGANAVPASAAIASTNALAMGFAAAGGAGFADGGRIFGPGSSTSDRISIRASADEYMVKARSARQVGYATLDYINQTGELPPGFAGGGRIRPMNARASAPYGGNGGMSEDALRRIEAAVERGAAAQAPVNLFPTTRPEHALQQALSTPGGRRAMFEFFNNEPNAIGRSLGRR